MSSGRENEDKPTIAAIRRAIDSGNWLLAEKLLSATDPKSRRDTSNGLVPTHVSNRQVMPIRELAVVAFEEDF